MLQSSILSVTVTLYPHSIRNLQLLGFVMSLACYDQLGGSFGPRIDFVGSLAFRHCQGKEIEKDMGRWEL